jgi:hypothetical protein
MAQPASRTAQKCPPRASGRERCATRAVVPAGSRSREAGGVRIRLARPARTLPAGPQPGTSRAGSYDFYWPRPPVTAERPRADLPAISSSHGTPPPPPETRCCRWCYRVGCCCGTPRAFCGLLFQEPPRSTHFGPPRAAHRPGEAASKPMRPHTVRRTTHTTGYRATPAPSARPHIPPARSRVLQGACPPHHMARLWPPPPSSSDALASTSPRMITRGIQFGIHPHRSARPRLEASARCPWHGGKASVRE